MIIRRMGTKKTRRGFLRIMGFQTVELYLNGAYCVPSTKGRRRTKDAEPNSKGDNGESGGVRAKKKPRRKNLRGMGFQTVVLQTHGVYYTPSTQGRRNVKAGEDNSKGGIL